MTKSLENHPSVLINKISKANKMIVEIALEQPGEYGRTRWEIAEWLARWTEKRDLLVAAYNALYNREI